MIKSLFFQRYIAVVILFTFVSVSGCAYRNAMKHETGKSDALTQAIEQENDRKYLLDKNKKELEEDIVNLTKEINEQDRQVNKFRAEIAILQQQKNKVESDIKQIQKQKAEIERLKAEIIEKKADVALKEEALESFSY